jgi:uncharacterized protein YjbJ (UPF0337 family)
MSDQTRDRIEGTVDQTKGRAKTAAGDLTGDERMQAEGRVDQTAGQGKQGLAGLMDRLGDMARKVTGGRKSTSG